MWLAKNEKEFAQMATLEAQSNELSVDQIFWIEKVSERLKKYDFEDYLMTLVEKAEEEGGCYFGVYHVWEEDE